MNIIINLIRSIFFDSLSVFIFSVFFSFNCFAQRDYYFRDSTTYKIDSSLSYIAGKRILYKNQNGVITKVKDFSIPNDSTFYIRDVDFADDQKGYVLFGSMYIGVPSLLYLTTNGGLSFKLDTSYYRTSLHKSINQVQFLDKNTIVLFDGYYESSVIRSFDGGQTWKMWFKSLIAHYFQMYNCNNAKWYLIGVPGDGFSSYSFPIPDSLWNKESMDFMSGCHNGNPECVRVWRDGDQDRKTDFIAKQIDTLTKLCSKTTSLQPVLTKSKMIVYPNPANDLFYIQNAEGEFYQLYDLQGNQWLSGKAISNNHVVSLSSIHNGTYVILIGQARFRIVKVP